MYLRPDLVDLTRLNESNSGEKGGILLGDDPRTTASAERGEQIVERLAARVTTFLANGHD